MLYSKASHLGQSTARKMNQDELKLDIKNWEHGFKKLNGRNPTREDIKSDVEIAYKYKLYRSLKAPITPSKKRQRHHDTKQYNTPQKTSPIDQQITKVKSSPLHQDIGPTPQLNGRVLGIFDVITSPQTTPSKTKPIDESVIQFQTPVKKLKFDTIDEVEDEHINDSDAVDSDGFSISSSFDNDNDNVSEFKTPQKPTIKNLFETPIYLKTSQLKQTITASPSPLASQRIRKGLTEIIDELKDIQDDLKYGDYDEDELLPLGEIDSNEVIEEDSKKDETPSTYTKKRTQKRTTRKVRMKARVSKEVDTMVNRNLKDEIQKLASIVEQEEEINPHEVDEEEEEWSEGEKEYVKEEVIVDPDAKVKKPAVRKNFVRLKINKKKGYFGKRSRR